MTRSHRLCILQWCNDETEVPATFCSAGVLSSQFPFLAFCIASKSLMKAKQSLPCVVLADWNWMKIRALNVEFFLQFPGTERWESRLSVQPYLLRGTNGAEPERPRRDLNPSRRDIVAWLLKLVWRGQTRFKLPVGAIVLHYFRIQCHNQGAVLPAMHLLSCLSLPLPFHHALCNKKEFDDRETKFRHVVY